MGKKALGIKAQSKLTSYSGYKRSVRGTGRNRNVFPFLELPVELRLQIYQYALPNRVGKQYKYMNRCHALGVRCMYDEERRYRHTHPKGFPALMSVNKLVYQETLDVLYGTLPPGSSPIIQLDVGADHIQIRGYDIFCEKHHVFDNVAEGIFTRFPCVELNVHAYCDAWPDFDEVSSTSEIEPDDDLQQSRQHSLRNNVRWVVTQLRRVKSLSSLVLNQADTEFYECHGHVLFMADLEFLFSPLRGITSLDKVELECFEDCSEWGCDCSLSYRDEENEDMGDAFVRFQTDLKKRMTSKQPVGDEPKVFNSYDDFIYMLKKCELAGTKVDTAELFRAAQHARENGHPGCLRSVMNRFAIEFRAEIDQRMAICNDIESFVNKAVAVEHGG